MSNRLKAILNKFRQDSNQDLIPLDYHPPWAESLERDFGGHIIHYHVITNHGIDPKNNTYVYELKLLTDLGIVELSIGSLNEPDIQIMQISCKLHKQYETLYVSFGEVKMYDPKLSDIPAMVYDLEREHKNYSRLRKIKK